MGQVGYYLFIVFITSWYLNLPTRIPILGVIRFDLLLYVAMVFLLIYEHSIRGKTESNDIHKNLKMLIIYVIITLPFVAEWPGTVIKSGFQQFLKASFFYFFIVVFVNSERKLQLFLTVYLVCQVFRVLEPLYLHMTEGYWGGSVSMLGGQESMTRLSGSPNDKVGANGLAFIIVTVIPFLYYFSAISWKHKFLFWSLLPPLVYALILTASRSGMIGLAIFVMYLIYQSNKKYLLIPLVLLVAAMVFVNLSPDMQDRYLSIFSSQTKHSATAQDRIDVPLEMSKLILRKPFFGHGLGTSVEANANYGTVVILPHNLFVELGIEIGLIGMVIFLLFIKSIVREISSIYSLLRTRFQDRLYLLKCSETIFVLLLMNLVFTMASYGLLIPVWYMFGGLVVVLKKLSDEQAVPT